MIRQKTVLLMLLLKSMMMNKMLWSLMQGKALQWSASRQPWVLNTNGDGDDEVDDGYQAVKHVVGDDGTFANEEDFDATGMLDIKQVSCEVKEDGQLIHQILGYSSPSILVWKRLLKLLLRRNFTIFVEEKLVSILIYLESPLFSRSAHWGVLHNYWGEEGHLSRCAKLIIVTAQPNLTKVGVTRLLVLKCPHHQKLSTKFWST